MRQFELVQAPKARRSAFDLSNERKTTLNMGDLVPVLCHEILPGDRIKMDFEAFLRTLPLVSPVMHRMNIFAHTFFVPMRLTLASERWEHFITKKVDESLPSMTAGCFGTGRYRAMYGDLLDHLGYGIIPGQDLDHANMSQLPLRAYHKIWNDHYRDQNFQTEFDFLALPDVIDNTISGPVLTELCTVRKRAWEKDYFTAALPTQQRGNVVSLPLGTHAPVKSTALRTGDFVNDTMIFEKPSGADTQTGNAGFGPNVPGDTQLVDSNSDPALLKSGLEADLSQAQGSTITALRRAFALQRWYEASMRFGQRYVEQLLGIFGVVSKDARLQRAEYLCGGKLPVQIGEVLQTSSTDGTSPQGNMAGRAVSAGHLFHLDRTFDEHGYLMIIVSVLPRTSYTDVTLRQNLKLDTFDFAFPQLAHLSEQPVYQAELYNNQDEPNAKLPFGYQPVYSEYRYIPDSVHGQFRDTLGFWSLARKFGSVPGLNESFISCDARTDIFPVDEADNQLLLQSFAKIIAIRPLPKFGTPV